MASHREQAVAVIDVGKTNIKLVAIGEDGNVLDEQNAPSVARNGALDSDGAWTWAHAALQRAAHRFDLAAIVPTTHGAAAAIVGDDGIIAPIADYEATPTEAIDADYDVRRPAFAETCSPRLPGGLNLGRQLYAMQCTDASTWQKARAVLTYPQFLSWRLSGAMASEVTSLGCHTDLWAPARHAFSSLVARESWTHLFPPIAPAWQPVGTLREDLGIAADCPILNGIHDSNAAYLRYLAGVSKPFTLLSTGTWMICFNGHGVLDALDPGRDTLANVDVCGRPIACSRFMGGREYAAIAGDVGSRAVEPSVRDVEAVIARRMFALPSFSHGGGPYPALAGRFMVSRRTMQPPQPLQSPQTSHTPQSPQLPGEAAALAALYCALMARESIRLTGPVQRLYIDGPFAGNDAFTASLAALMPDAEVHASSASNGTSIGASLLASMARDGDGRIPRIDIASHRIDAGRIAIDDYASEWQELVERSAA
jgi:L-fuculokinase